jgi:hypothetical protein
MFVLGGGRFTNNYSGGNAAVIMDTGSIATVTGCNFTNNSAIGTSNSAAVHQTNLNVCTVDSGMFTSNVGEPQALGQRSLIHEQWE